MGNGLITFGENPRFSEGVVSCTTLAPCHLRLSGGLQSVSVNGYTSPCPIRRMPWCGALIVNTGLAIWIMSVSNSSSGRRWKLDHAPAVGDPTHMVEFGTGRRAFAREA